MPKTKCNLLHIVYFSGLSKWSTHEAVFDNVNNNYPLVPLSKVLKRIKEPITIEDDSLYKRITVRLYGKGVLKRDEVYGREIGTKRQFVAHAGQLIISRIDARNGAFGLVPKELEGAIVTNDFWLFDVHDALPEYLMLVLSSDLFQKYWQTQSSGTTNRQRVSENNFLSSTIALPQIEEQKKLITNYKTMTIKANDADKKAQILFESMNKTIEKILGVSYISMNNRAGLSIVRFRDLSRWDPLYLTSSTVIRSIYPLVSLSKVINNFLVDHEGKSLRRNTKDEKGSEYQYIGMEHIEKNTGLRTKYTIDGSEVLSQTLLVPEGYIIYGKLRPYLNKYWVNTIKNETIICSSEFFVFDTTNIEKAYFLSVLSSSILQKQLPSLYSGARMPRITENDFMGLKIPLPPQKVQEEVALLSENMKKEMESLRNFANRVRKEAKREFEEAVFGEA